MIGKARLLLAIKDFLARRELTPILVEELNLPENLVGLVDVAFRDVNNIIVIHVFDEVYYTQIEAREAVEKTVVKLSPLRAFVEKVYIAIPETYAVEGVLNPPLIRESGIGVLKVTEDERVEEIIPAKGSLKHRPEVAYRLVEDIKKIREEVNELKKLYDELKRNIESLEGKISNLEGKVSLLEINLKSRPRTSITEKPKVQEKEQFEGKIVDDSTLPSFVRDNPWFLELRKRGKVKNG